MKTPDKLIGSLNLLVMKVLARRGPLHGYAIISAVEELSAKELGIEEGSLYPALHRMEESGVVSAEWITRDNGKRARVYRITAQGRKELAKEEERWSSVVGAVQRVLKYV
jgi:PadR family transcriptional regulator PadR